MHNSLHFHPPSGSNSASSISNRRGSGKKGSFDDRARMVLIVGSILLSELGFIVYGFVRDPTVLVTNQALTFIIFRLISVNGFHQGFMFNADAFCDYSTVN